jgi:hypothetical protein
MADCIPFLPVSCLGFLSLPSWQLPLLFCCFIALYLACYLHPPHIASSIPSSFLFAGARRFARAHRSSEKMYGKCTGNKWGAEISKMTQDVMVMFSSQTIEDMRAKIISKNIALILAAK